MIQLAEQPFRFRQLAYQLQTSAGERIDDNALTRSLRRLTHNGLITAEPRRVGRREFKLYRLTDKGREQVNMYGTVVAVFTRKAEDDHHHGCCLHRSETDS